MNVMDRTLNLLQEEIYGNMATVYHRTGHKDLINAVYDGGFQPGDGAYYGRGFYSTYKLSSQERDGMKRYGDLVVKFAVPLTGFFFLDWSEFKKMELCKKLKSTEETYLEDQIKHYKIRNVTDEFDVEEAKRSIKMQRKTSSVAKWLHTYTDINMKVSGLVFTGDIDGKVLLSYETNIVIPLSYRKDGEETFTKVPRDKKYFKKALTAKNNIETSVGNREVVDWIRKADVRSSSYTIRKVDNTVIWKGGVWNKGTWKGGEWEGGIWRDGTWEKGNFRNGEWRDGTWKGGFFDQSSWRDGIWENGTFGFSHWTTGTWKDGEFQGSWHGGKWIDGTWKGQYWGGGWIYDPEKKGNFEKKWEWKDGFVNSWRDPAMYWKGKK